MKPTAAPGTAFVVSFHDTGSGTCEVPCVFEASARTLFAELQSVPTVADVQLFRDGVMIGSWERPWASGTYIGPPQGWTCFHCGETFHTRGRARDHFGADPIADPACRIKYGKELGLVMALREAEAELARYRAEDSDKDRELGRIRAEHQTALRHEEETGYARGLRDERARCLRIIARVKAGLRNGGARKACDAIAGDLNDGRGG